MPELPEVEVCRQGISPHLCGHVVVDVIVRHKQLRWLIPDEVNKIKGDELLSVDRRSKYLLLRFNQGTLLVHLGMSGTIRVLDGTPEVKKHDHFDLKFSNNKCLRFNDPRRFGAILWFEQHVDEQGILAKLGPEPLLEDFGPGYLFEKAKNRKVPIKTFLMNNHIVVGVGNIYANEALFQAGILPITPVNKITRSQFDKLTDIIKSVLSAAIEQGGTTLKDFTQADGKPGYFAQQLNVYGRAGKKCLVCETKLEEIRQSNRSSVFCPNCQR
ncbi:bifunctional DNA-formamidopyrimidine glycosylase/DNA-(apurinic or apyrimidinic site) lyase [Thalassotalea piscium]|uniref:Formamidopyrimidine-DNA glycosylase n=1 Tax=Thalassotalea piscium TaxID=1230533 RepID=A0A7X0TSD9_9GAMM|nr:bifunctional DNA-formamidopyrimidine glycosylase/DNA-(apurinic or apyrimidinic site) lyase [Thalassotalea piscium]MBB6542038.1 formamidopyrimidine-DNA glycosylase [Thalassotalea piscium]